MKINERNVSRYVESFLNSIFKEKIRISCDKQNYIVSFGKSEVRYPIYKFWKTKDYDINVFKKDPIGIIFFFLTGYYEYIHKELCNDEYDRFPAKESFQYKNNLLEIPIVDLNILKIENDLSKLGLYLKRKDFFTKPKIFITHDIDHLGLFSKRKTSEVVHNMLGDLMKRKDFRQFFEKLILILTNKDPCTIEHLIELHKKHRTKGTFFLLNGKQPMKYGKAGYDVINYMRYFEDIAQKINFINGNIGVHYEPRYLINPQKISNAIDKITSVTRKSILAGRSHYLMFEVDKSYKIYDEVGIKLDTTGGYADSIGFRFGTSLPFKPYNFTEGKTYNVIEVPLIIMDGTLKGYMGLKPDEAFEKIKSIMSFIEKTNGVFTFLWHNTSFYHNGWKQWEWLYEKIIEYAKDHNFDFVVADEIIEGVNNA